MITSSTLVGFMLLGILAGIALAMAAHSAWQSVSEMWESECNDAREGKDGFYCPSGFTVMDIPNSEYSKLMYIRNHGVEQFVDACKRGEFVGVTNEN